LSAADPTVVAMTDTEFSASENMDGRLTAAQFSASPGVTDWRVLWGGGYAAARFLTGSFAAGLTLVTAIGELAAASGHDPDVDVRPESVTVRLCTSEIRGLTSPGRRPGQGDFGGRGPAAGAARPGGRAARAGRDRRPGYRQGSAVLARGARLRRSRRRGPA
jgi:pterin-4a-carbinolamine dehydratase